MKTSYSRVETRSPSSLRSWLMACGAGAALALAGASQATTVTGVNAFTTADGHASVLFNFDFGSTLDLASFGATLSYDASVLSLDELNPAVVTGADLPDDFLASSVSVTPGSLFALFFANPSPLTVASQVQVQFNFLSTVAPGAPSKVTFDFDYVDFNDPELAPVILPTASATVSAAVPEPESLALLLAGAGVVAAWGRRRATGAVHA